MCSEIYFLSVRDNIRVVQIVTADGLDFDLVFESKDWHDCPPTLGVMSHNSLNE